jgi:hypothetical protein
MFLLFNKNFYFFVISYDLLREKKLLFGGTIRKEKKKNFREPVSNSHGLLEKPGDRSGANALVSRERERLS